MNLKDKIEFKSNKENPIIFNILKEDIKIKKKKIIKNQQIIEKESPNIIKAILKTIFVASFILYMFYLYTILLNGGFDWQKKSKEKQKQETFKKQNIKDNEFKRQTLILEKLKIIEKQNIEILKLKSVIK